MRIADAMLGVILLGLFLFGGSFFYPQVSGSQEANWSEEDAKEFQKLSSDLHALDSKFGAERARNPEAQPSPELARVTDSYQQKEQKLVEAQHAGQFMAKIMFVCGIGLVVIGGVGYLAMNGADD